MTRVKFEDGTVINFEGQPNPQDIEEAYNQVSNNASGIVKEPLQKTTPLDDVKTPEVLSSEQNAERNKKQAFSDIFNPKSYTPEAIGGRFKQAGQEAYREVVSPIMSGISTAAFGIPKMLADKAKLKEALFPEQQSIPGKVARGVAESAGFMVGGPAKLGAKAVSKFMPKVATKVLPKMAKGAIQYGTAGGSVVPEKTLTQSPGNTIKEALFKTVTGAGLGAGGELAAPGIQRFIKNPKGSMPQIMNDEWLKKQARQAYGIADKGIKATQQEAADIYSKIGDVAVNRNKFNDIIGNVHGGAKTDAIGLLDDLKVKYPDGVVRTNIADAKQLKDIVQDYIPSSAWTKGKRGGNLTPGQQKLVKAYFDLKNLIHEHTPEKLKPVLTDYEARATKAYRVGKAVKGMVTDQTGEPVKTSQLVSTFSGGGSKAGAKDIFKRLAEINPEGNQVIKNMEKYKTRQTVKSVGKKAVGAGIAGYSGYEILKRLFGGGGH